MKTKILAAIVAFVTVAQADTLKEILEHYREYDNITRGESQSEREARMWQAIYTAYPNNPELYRYLERNPEKIKYYLGREY